ncbi:MAG: putative monovalent cation/H+ antiporter subunit A [Candidatus Tectimicrobiota bacterium]
MANTCHQSSATVRSTASAWRRRLTDSGATGWMVALLPLGLTLYFASYITAVAAGSTFAVGYAWVPVLGVNLSVYLDGLGLLFALLITSIGTLVLIYAGSYLAGHPHLGRFYLYLLTFMAAMLGLVLADNLVTLFLCWELTSLSSYLLIGFEHRRAEARAAALQALLTTGVGGLALLVGLLLLGQAGGSLELSRLVQQGEIVRAHTLYVPIVLLTLLGACTKSAQFPFHCWLPEAMAAPTPVSAYLHSATMVKAGVYLLARLTPVLGGTETWRYALTAVGAVTMLVGGLLALGQTDLKRMLAYSTISALGILVLLIGLGTREALTAAMVFLLAHALYKGALFMVAGVIDHETGTRDVEHLGGLRHTMPVTTVVAVLAALSLAGCVPFLSFMGKEMLLAAVLASPVAWPLVTLAAVLAGASFVTVAMLVGQRPFFGVIRPTPQPSHEAPLSLWIGPALLATLGLLLGLLPWLVAPTLIAPSVAAVLGYPLAVELGLWHGLNGALGLSAVSIGLGLLVAACWKGLRRMTARCTRLCAWGPASWYGLSLGLVNRFATAQTRLLQHGSLRLYLVMIIATTVGLTGYTLVYHSGLPGVSLPTDLRLYEVGLGILILLAALAAVRSSSRLGAVAALGVVGFGVGLMFLFFGAPDLAMTQFLVETLTVILLVLVLYRLPRYVSLSSPTTRLRDLLIALTAGGVMTALVLAAAVVPPEATVSQYYAEHSLTKAHGRNIVNVILVDFRGLDTLGEIAVLTGAAVGVYALLKLRPAQEKAP